MQNVSALPVAGLREKPARLVGFMIRRAKEIISFVMGLAVPALPKDFVREHGAWKKKACAPVNCAPSCLSQSSM